MDRLSDIINNKKYLAVVLGSAKLTTEPGGKGQVNPYFKPTIATNGKITCVQVGTQTGSGSVSEPYRVSVIPGL